MNSPLPGRSGVGLLITTLLIGGLSACDTGVGLLLGILLVGGLSGCGQQQPVSQAAEPGAPEVARVTVPQGTEVQVSLSTAIGSETSRVGDAISVTTTDSVLVEDRVAIPTGSTIQGHVREVSAAKNSLRVSKRGGAVAILFERITTPHGLKAPMSASLTGSGIAGTSGMELVIPVGTLLEITLDRPLILAER